MYERKANGIGRVVIPPAVTVHPGCPEPAIDLDGTEAEMIKLSRRLRGNCGQALFFEVMVVNADQRCSTFLLAQCGLGNSLLRICRWSSVWGSRSRRHAARTAFQNRSIIV